MDRLPPVLGEQWHLWANVLFGFFGLLLFNMPLSRAESIASWYVAPSRLVGASAVVRRDNRFPAC